MTHELPNNHMAVEVPERIDHLEYSVQDDGLPCITYFSYDNIDPSVITLPPGSWSIVCLQSEVTEEVAIEIIPHTIMQEVDFQLQPIGEKTFTYWVGQKAYHEAVPAFRSLMAAKEIKHSVILKRHD